MKKNIRLLLTIALLVLVLLMALSMAACNKEEAPAQSTDTPAAVESQTPAEETAAPTPSPETILPTATPVPTANAEGQLTFTSMSKGFSFRYDEKYIALSNQADNAMIYPAGDTTLPYCSVALLSEADASGYLSELAAGVNIELEGSIKTAPGEPAAVEIEGRDVYTMSYSYTYDGEEFSGTVVCTYYAENLGEGQVAVFSSTALEEDSETVEAILQLAMDSFKLD